MSVHLLLKSAVLGLSIAAPVGPIGILRGRLSRPLYAAINPVSGLVLAGFGLYTLVGLYG